MSGDQQGGAVVLSQAQQLLTALGNITPGTTQSALLRPGTVDFAELIAQMQHLQAAGQGGSGSSPELIDGQPNTPQVPEPNHDNKKAQDAAAMPPPSTIPTKPKGDVLPATRPNSPAPPSLADRAGAPIEAAKQAQESLEEAARQIQAGWEKPYLKACMILKSGILIEVPSHASLECHNHIKWGSILTSGFGCKRVWEFVVDSFKILVSPDHEKWHLRTIY